MNILKKFEEWVGGALLLIIFVILLAQIGSRLLNSPLIWSEELGRLLFVYAGLLGISIGVHKQQHIYIDFITNMMNDKVRKFSNSIIQLLILISIFFFIKLGLHVWNDANFEIVSLEISEKWLFAPVPFISLLILFRFFEVQKELYKANLSYIPPYCVFLNILD